MTGSNVPGQIAMRLSGAMDLDQRVAVAANIEQLELKLQRIAAVTLGDDASLGGEHRRQRRRELRRERARVTIWRIKEHEIVLRRATTCSLEEFQHRLAMDLGLDPEPREVASDRA